MKTRYGRTGVGVLNLKHLPSYSPHSTRPTVLISNVDALLETASVMTWLSAFVLINVVALRRDRLIVERVTVGG